MPNILYTKAVAKKAKKLKIIKWKKKLTNIEPIDSVFFFCFQFYLGFIPRVSLRISKRSAIYPIAKKKNLFFFKLKIKYLNDQNKDQIKRPLSS